MLYADDIDPDLDAWLDARAEEYLAHLDASPEALDAALAADLEAMVSGHDQSAVAL